MVKEVEQYYLNKEEPNKSCLLALRDIILNQDEAVTETQKWGMPCFCFKKKPFCYLWIDKRTNKPYILMVEGKLIDHPMLEEGDRAKMKILRIDPEEDLPLELIVEVLNLGLNLYLNGTIKLK